MTESDLPTAAEMIDAFVHPPRVVVVGERREVGEDRVLVVSHVELWPWRVVVRGTMANRQPTTIDPADDQRTRAGFRDHAELMSNWSLTDDVGTEYHSDGAGTSGWATDMWADFDVLFHPPAPTTATALAVRSPEGVEFNVPLRLNA